MQHVLSIGTSPQSPGHQNTGASRSETNQQALCAMQQSKQARVLLDLRTMSRCASLCQDETDDIRNVAEMAGVDMGGVDLLNTLPLRSASSLRSSMFPSAICSSSLSAQRTSHTLETPAGPKSASLVRAVRLSCSADHMCLNAPERDATVIAALRLSQCTSCAAACNICRHLLGGRMLSHQQLFCLQTFSIKKPSSSSCTRPGAQSQSS